MKKKLIFIAFSMIAMIGLTACNKLDVIGDYSVKSFRTLMDNMKDNVTEDTVFGGWSLEAPDGEARVLWSEDFSKTNPDVMMEVDAKPFLDAGLDTSKLPEGMLVGDKIVVGEELGNETFSYAGEADPLATYEQIVDHYRDNIGYHIALDHFGLSLSGGNMFEWAKDMAKNDKDIVFVLNPEPFLEAGVDTSKLQGWTFATVPTMDENGRKTQADKLLKPFDLVKEK